MPERQPRPAALPLASLIGSALASGSAANWRVAAVARARAALQSLPMPDERSEAWRYTSLPALQLAGALLAGHADAATPPAAPADSTRTSGIELDGVAQVLFVDGRLRELPDLEHIGLGRAEATVPALFGTLAPQSDAFVAMNTALLGDVLCIDVPAGHDGGVLFVHHSTGSGLRGQVAPRCCVRLQANARLTLVERISCGDGLHNLVSEIALESGAQLRHWRSSHGGAATSVARTYVDVGEGAEYLGFQQLEGGGRVREELLIRLVGEGASAKLAGVAHVQGRDHADLALRIEHAASRTRSTSFYRGIAGERGRLVFKGQIHIPKGVHAIDAALTSKNLLLSNDAEIDARPELTINADDVRCSHGATVGQMDADALFLLRARGIDDALARALLKRAFAMAAFTALPESAADTDVRMHFRTRLQALLGTHA